LEYIINILPVFGMAICRLAVQRISVNVMMCVLSYNVISVLNKYSRCIHLVLLCWCTFFSFT